MGVVAQIEKLIYINIHFQPQNVESELDFELEGFMSEILKLC